MKLSKDCKNNIGHEFLDIYFENRGFGNMTKRDIELALYFLLKKHGCLSNGGKKMSYFEISKALHLSESRIKNMDYDSELIYGKGDEEVRLRALLPTARPKGDGKHIKFSIDDKYLRMYCYSVIKSFGSFADTSFNNDLVVVDIDTYTNLITHFYQYDLKVQKQLIEACKAAFDSQQKEKLDFKWALKKIAEGACTEAGTLGVDAIASIFTGIPVSSSIIKEAEKVIKVITDKIKNSTK